jgi:hypothetical protein
MLFRHSLRNATYVIEPATPAGRGPDGSNILPQRGLRARFKGPQHLFDSSNKGWADEQRLRVERHLLTHKHFYAHKGAGYSPVIYLEPGQTKVLRDEHSVPMANDSSTTVAEYALSRMSEAGQEIAAGVDVSGAPEPKGRCMFIRTTEEASVQCRRPAKEGSNYCAQHESKVAELASVGGEAGVTF